MRLYRTFLCICLIAIAMVGCATTTRVVPKTVSSAGIVHYTAAEIAVTKRITKAYDSVTALNYKIVQTKGLTSSDRRRLSDDVNKILIDLRTASGQKALGQLHNSELALGMAQARINAVTTYLEAKK